MTTLLIITHLLAVMAGALVCSLVVAANRKDDT
jgi:hypothetical protein